MIIRLRFIWAESDRLIVTFDCCKMFSEVFKADSFVKEGEGIFWFERNKGIVTFNGLLVFSKALKGFGFGMVSVNVFGIKRKGLVENGKSFGILGLRKKDGGLFK